MKTKLIPISKVELEVRIFSGFIKGYRWVAGYYHSYTINYKSKKTALENWKQFAKVNGIKKWRLVE